MTKVNPISTYGVPLAKTLATDVDFWEVIYRRVAEQDPFELWPDDFSPTANLLHNYGPNLYDPKTFRAYVDEATSPMGELVRRGEGRYSLRQAARIMFATPRDEYVEKPVSYIDNKWYLVLGSHRHSKWLLNFLLYYRARQQGFPPFVDVYHSLKEQPFTFSQPQLRHELETLAGRQVEFSKIQEALARLAKPPFSMIRVTSPSSFPTVRRGVELTFWLNAGIFTGAPEPRESSFGLALDKVLTGFVVPHYWKLHELYNTLNGHGSRTTRFGPLNLREMSRRLARWLEVNYHIKPHPTLEHALILLLKDFHEELDREGILKIVEREGSGEDSILYCCFTSGSDLLESNDREARDFIRQIASRAHATAYKSSLEDQLRQRLLPHMEPALRRDRARAEMCIRVGVQLRFEPLMCQDLFTILGKWYDRVSPAEYKELEEFLVAWGIGRLGAFSHKEAIDAFFKRKQDASAEMQSSRWLLSLQPLQLTAKSKRLEGMLRVPEDYTAVHTARLERVLKMDQPHGVNTRELNMETLLADNQGKQLFRDSQPIVGLVRDYLTPYPDITAQLRSAILPLRVVVKLTRAVPGLSISVRIQYRGKTGSLA